MVRTDTEVVWTKDGRKIVKEINSEMPKGGKWMLQYTTLPLIFNTNVSVAILSP